MLTKRTYTVEALTLHIINTFYILINYNTAKYYYYIKTINVM